MSYESYYEQIKKQTASDRQSAKDKSNQLYENQKTAAQDQYNAQIRDTTSAYDDNYRMARIQKAINERQIAENMANMGLTDSGLNRTQITANQLSYGNTVGKLNVAKQKAVDALALALRGSLTDIENNRLAAEAKIDESYDKYASEAATDMYKADVAAASKTYSGGGSSGGGNKKSASLSDIKTSIKNKLLTEDEFDNQKGYLISRNKPQGRIVDGNKYVNYETYKADIIMNILGNYMEKGYISADDMDYYYFLLTN